MIQFILITTLLLRMRKIPAKFEQFNPRLYERPGLTEQDILEIKESFDLFDKDCGGSIDPKQLKAAMTSLGFQAKNQTVYQMVADLDADGTGQIDFQEFLKLMTVKEVQKDTRESVSKVFHLFKDQATGFISVKSLRRVAKQLGQTVDQTQLQQMIQKADLNRDGMVSEEEFYNLVTKKTFSN